MTNAKIISHISNLLPFPDFFFKNVKRKVNMNHTTSIVTIIFSENIDITILSILIICNYLVLIIVNIINYTTVLSDIISIFFCYC